MPDETDVAGRVVRRGQYPELTWPAVLIGNVLGGLICISIGYAALILGFSIAARTSGAAAYQLQDDIQVIESSLQTIVEGLAATNNRSDSLYVYEVHHWVDAALAEELERLADAREALAHRYGLQRYADLLSRFAAGDRNLSRAWSALADGYIDDVRGCLQRAEVQMTQARDLMRGWRTASGNCQTGAA
ncbi:MAG: hypothetical protein ACYSUQ_12845 [Planctomycetota bacterium]